MTSFNPPTLEVADIFKKYEADYRKKYKLTSEHEKVFHDIQHCRDGSFGYRLDQCDHCAETQIIYNS